MLRRMKKWAFSRAKSPFLSWRNRWPAWRGRGPRQALLAKALSFIDVLPLDAALGMGVLALCSPDRTSDVIDAAIRLLARTRPDLTLPTSTISTLAAASGRHVYLVAGVMVNDFSSLLRLERKRDADARHRCLPPRNLRAAQHRGRSWCRCSRSCCWISLAVTLNRTRAPRIGNRCGRRDTDRVAHVSPSFF